MSVVHKFMVSKAGKDCVIDTISHQCCCKLVIGKDRSVVKFSMRPFESTELILERIVIDDGYHLIEYPIQIVACGASCASKRRAANYSTPWLERKGIDPKLRFSLFETYLVVLEKEKYQIPITGWIHYRLVKN